MLYEHFTSYIKGIAESDYQYGKGTLWEHHLGVCCLLLFWTDKNSDQNALIFFTAGIKEVITQYTTQIL